MAVPVFAGLIWIIPVKVSSKKNKGVHFYCKSAFFKRLNDKYFTKVELFAPDFRLTINWVRFIFKGRTTA